MWTTKLAYTSLAATTETYKDEIANLRFQFLVSLRRYVLFVFSPFHCAVLRSPRVSTIHMGEWG